MLQLFEQASDGQSVAVLENSDHPMVQAEGQDWAVFIVTTLVGLFFSWNSNYTFVILRLLTANRCTTQRVSILMAGYYFYMHMTRYVDSGFQANNYDLIALMIFQFI